MPDLAKLLGDENVLIQEIQRNRPLKIIGHSPFVYNAANDSILTNCYLYDERYRKMRYANALQIEALSLFTPNAVLYKNSLFPLGERIILELDVADFRTRRISESISFRRKTVLRYRLSSYDYVHFFKAENGSKIAIPAYVIGSFFYYPNSHVKRALFEQNVEILVNHGLSNCKNGKLCFASRRIAFNQRTAFLAYLYHCDERARSRFYDAYSFYFRVPIKKALEKGKKTVFLNPGFVFPVPSGFDGKLPVSLRGEWIEENLFFAYEIVDVNFERLIGRNKVTVFYEGRRMSRTFEPRGIALKKSSVSSVSHTHPYSSSYEQKDIEIVRDVSEINKAVVEKGKPVYGGERSYLYPRRGDADESEGITFGDGRDGRSRMAKAELIGSEFDFRKAMKLLEKRLGLEEKTKLVDKPDYFGFLFWMNGKNYFVLELKGINTYTLLFSSRKPLEYERVAKETIEVRRKRRSYKHLAKEVEKYKVKLHTPQRHITENLKKWIERLIKKL